MKFTIFPFNDFNHSPSAAQAGIKATIRSAALLCAIMTAASSHAATRVFYDGSEAGNTNLWFSDGTRNRCTSVTSAADGVTGPYAGSRMIRCNSDGTAAWNSAQAFETMQTPYFSVNSEAFYRVRVRVDQNHDKSQGSAKKILRLFTGDTENYESIRTSSGMTWEGGVAGIQQPTYWGETSGDNTAMASGWHLIERYVSRATGTVKVWHDGVLVVNRTNGTFSGSIGENRDFFLTSNYSDAHDATNYVYFDEFEVFSDSTSGTSATGSMADRSIIVNTSGQNALSPPHITEVKVN